MKPHKTEDLLYEFIGNFLYLNEVENYRKLRFMKTYSKSSMWHKGEQAQLFCDLFAAEYIDTIEQIIKKRQIQIANIIKNKEPEKFKRLTKNYSIIFDDKHSLIVPITNQMDLYEGEFIEMYSDVENVQDLLFDCEYENYKLQYKGMCDDETIMEEMRRIERDYFKKSKGLSTGKDNFLQFYEPNKENLIDFFIKNNEVDLNKHFENEEDEED